MGIITDEIGQIRDIMYGTGYLFIVQNGSSKVVKK